MTEYNQAGDRIIREDGWLPGIEAAGRYQYGDLTLFVEGKVFDGSINYDGLLQSGQSFRTKTGTVLSSTQIGLQYSVLKYTDILTGLEYDIWRRNIRGRGDVTGIREETKSLRTFLGLQQRWQVADHGNLTATITYIHSEPEHLKVHFFGALDDTSLRTKSAEGYLLGLRFRPIQYPQLELAAQFDHLNVARSAPHVVTRNGQRVGTITQPEHTRQSYIFSVRYTF